MGSERLKGCDFFSGKSAVEQVNAVNETNEIVLVDIICVHSAANYDDMIFHIGGDTRIVFRSRNFPVYINRDSSPSQVLMVYLQMFHFTQFPDWPQFHFPPISRSFSQSAMLSWVMLGSRVHLGIACMHAWQHELDSVGHPCGDK